jgi:hypothetical protein
MSPIPNPGLADDLAFSLIAAQHPYRSRGERAYDRDHPTYSR